jgi:hypothetical protein
MKLQIDTVAKTIKIDETVNLNALCTMLESLLPGEWKNYSLITGTVIYWPAQPIIYDWRNPLNVPIYQLPATICTSGVYNVECSIN